MSKQTDLETRVEKLTLELATVNGLLQSCIAMRNELAERHQCELRELNRLIRAKNEELAKCAVAMAGLLLR